MEKYVWLFPILFIFHDMEEIIGLGIWLRKNKEMINKRFPKISQIYENYSTEGMALAVLEELLFCILICMAAVFINLYELWIGCFLAYIIHLFVHIIQSVVIRKYIPAVITSIIAIPISIFIVYKSILLLGYTVGEIILYGVLGVFIVLVNLKIAHIIMTPLYNFKIMKL